MSRRSETKDDSVEVLPGPSPPEKIRVGGVKSVLVMLLLFLFVISDVFVNSVLTCFGGAVKGRAPSNGGKVLQGIFFVLFFIVATYLMEHSFI